MSDVVASISSGKLRGIKQRSPFFDAEFYSFYAIPYAEPPIGNLRFRDPIKIAPWKSIRDATTEKQGCAQYSLQHMKFMGTEDCLYLNVHTPKLPSPDTPLKAVVVLIHPGGNLWGSPDSSHHGSPNYVMQNDVVYVTIGYRLNIFGFLNLKLEYCSGNQGLKDIILALNWVKDNIRCFNGDPKNITLFGSSSGASLVHLLMLSPAAKGLFHKAIAIGNSAFNCLVVRQDDQISLALDFGKQLGFTGNNTRQLLLFLKSLSVITIVEGIRTLNEKISDDVIKAAFGSLFTAAIDQGKHAVLPASPRKLIDSMTRLPVIFGICDREAVAAFCASTIESTEKNFKKWYRNNTWGWTYTLDDNEIDEIQQEIESFYNKTLADTHSPLAIKDAILSDAVYSEIYDTLINPAASEFPSSTYVYKFQYDTVGNAAKIGYNQYTIEKFTGSYHFDDFCYWACIVPPTSPETIEIAKIITKLFTNFAKTGNPNFENMQVQWKPSTVNEPCYLSMNNTFAMIDGKLNNERYEFWDRLKKQYKRD